MTDSRSLSGQQSVDSAGQGSIDRLARDFEARWKRGDRPRIEDYLDHVDASNRTSLLLVLLSQEIEFQRAAGETVLASSYRRRFPDAVAAVDAAFALASAGDPTLSRSELDQSTPAENRALTKAEPTVLPKSIDRYEVRLLLGQGGFGMVYLCRDPDLDRLVAVKAPHARLVSRTEDLQAHLAEARTVAKLDHPNIVPVYDVGGAEPFPCYIVSKFIDGADLATRLKESKLSNRQAAELVALVAEALHYAHKQGVVHRDVKPGNILLDKTGQPFVTDFGLALREQDLGKGPRYAGTPAYMSPEQASGEGHRVDGRSDIFSLGVVFYELLTGRRPFRGDTQDELLEQVKNYDPRPPRQLDDVIPRELERICLKALSKRASERYTTAKDLAEDLRFWEVGSEEATRDEVRETKDSKDRIESRTPAAKNSPSKASPIVPKGLRSFDATDADFFLELLPGPRDRDGLPESLRFWKSRIEAVDPEATFAVGLMIGPSGCGKSSLVKAGLIPRLADSVTVVYVEATADETEARLLSGLRRFVPDLPGDLNLCDTLATLRKGRHSPTGRKIVLVLDQFEQWLHANGQQENAELTRALRQCDGGRLQAIILTRDDFGLAATRFTRALEIRLREGENFATVDLFDPVHAQKVLAAFGLAYGRLPVDLADGAKEERTFIDQAVAGLAQDGKIVPVHLALFAEMMKGKPWTPATLTDVGGMEGVGVTFLEETFAAPSAPPQHRIHQKAARAVLKSLLPDAGADIKGHKRTWPELLDASGYGTQRREFDDLLRILDTELRLITPADRDEDGDSEVAGSSSSLTGQSPFNSSVDRRAFQLTHDYLVPSLRDWLTSKQKETRRGRAELRLADHSATWNLRPENRFLPSLAEFLSIRLRTDPKKWSAPQRKMMAKAGRVHGLRAILAAAALGVVAIVGVSIHDRVVEKQNQTRADGLLTALFNADTAQVPMMIGELADYRDWANPGLRTAFEEADADSAKKLHAGLALAPVEETSREYLVSRLLRAEPGAFPVIRDALANQSDSLVERLWSVAIDDKAESNSRFRAACALAQFASEDKRWAQISPWVASELTKVSPVYLRDWMTALEPVKDELLTPLAVIYRDPKSDEGQRALDADVLAEFSAERTEILADLARDASPRQFAVVFPKLAEHGQRAIDALRERLASSQAPAWPDKPLEKTWTSPDPALVERITAAGGVVAERFALLQNLPLAEFTNLTERLRPFGYRPLRFRPCGDGKTVRVAAIWTRDGRDFRLASGATAAQMLASDEQNRGDGFLAEDLAAYLEPSDATALYAAVWLKRTSESEDARIFLDQADQNFLTVGDTEYGYATVPQSLSKDGALVNERPELFSYIVRKPPVDSRGQRNPIPALITAKGVRGQLPIDVVYREIRAAPPTPSSQDSQTVAPGDPNVLLVGLWQSDTEYESVSLLSLAPDAHASKCQELTASGFRPLSIAIHTLAEYSSVWSRPWLTESTKVDFALRQSRVAAALLRLGAQDTVWPLLAHGPEPDVRSHLIHALAPLGCDPRELVQRFEVEKDVSVRRSILLALGEFSQEQFPVEARAPLAEKLLSIYEFDADPGLRAAAEWLLRRWGQGDQRATVVAKLRLNESQLRSRDQADPRKWYVNTLGQTFVVFEPGEFLMGSPLTEVGTAPDEVQHARKLVHRFAIAAHEVTLAEFAEFLAAHKEVVVPRIEVQVKTEDSPRIAMTWYEATWYCNWLSEKEGIPSDQWCYVPNEHGQFAAGMKAKENAANLIGYRLPTEAEWEYACRAGAMTSRFFGSSDRLLGKYAWYAENGENRVWPAGSLKPNDMGLFDILGNVYEWCQDPVHPYPSGGEPMLDRFDTSPANDATHRVTRGASAFSNAPGLRSAYRAILAPTLRGAIGLRPTRTYP